MKNTDSIITELVASLHCKACPFSASLLVGHEKSIN